MAGPPEKPHGGVCQDILPAFALLEIFPPALLRRSMVLRFRICAMATSQPASAVFSWLLCPIGNTGRLGMPGIIVPCPRARKPLLSRPNPNPQGGRHGDRTHFLHYQARRHAP